MAKLLLKSTFEEGVLIRDLGDIGQAPDVALAELVANAWDAGATIVRIDVPEELDGTISIHDDGVGLTESQFEDRRMRYGYNRTDKQGRDAEFPPSRPLVRSLGRSSSMGFSGDTIRSVDVGPDAVPRDRRRLLKLPEMASVAV
jgi:hypothetical protein